ELDLFHRPGQKRENGRKHKSVQMGQTNSHAHAENFPHIPIGEGRRHAENLLLAHRTIRH
ncbi:hypothetical protein, partial [Pseudoneobacillus sp. C159]